MGQNGGPKLPLSSLSFLLDAGNPTSYSGTGLTVFDLVSAGLGATLVSGVGFGTTNLGSFNFVGTNDFINVLINTGLFSNEGTMIIWLKNNEATSASESNTGFMGFGTGGQNDHYPWTDGAAYLSTFRNARTTGITLSTSVTRSDIHMVSVTSNSSEWKLYQNAVLQYTTSSSGSVTMTRTRIGYSIDQAYRYMGKVYYFMLYNRALTADEIKKIYNALKGRYGL